MKNIQYCTRIQPLKCSKEDYEGLSKLNAESAKVWNECVRLDKIYRYVANHSISRFDFQRIFKTMKDINLHAKGRQHVIKKYCENRDNMWASIKAKHKNSSKVNLPYKYKKFYTTGWDSQSVRTYGNYILLPKPLTQDRKLQTPYKCYIKDPPSNIVEVELIHRGDKYCLAIKYKIDSEYLQIKSNNEASIDLGEIHSITSIDNNGHALIITGRKLRSIKQDRNKNLGELVSKRDKCVKHSRQWWKYNKAIQKLKWKYDKKILDAMHKISKLYVDYCLIHNISKVYYGDLDNCTRNTKKRNGRFVNQKLAQWNYGQLIKLLQNKLSKHNIELVKISEAWSSKKCPACGKLNKPKGRNYYCRRCNYTMHRDVNGAINILNDNGSFKLTRYNTLKYLRIA